MSVAPRSLGFRTDLAVRVAEGSLLERHDGFWCLRSPTTPNGAAGTGDVNANLSALSSLLGWSVQVVAEDTPAMTDWMKPYEKLTYDINHSDGFWVIDKQQIVRFASGNLPAFTGTIAKALSKFMARSRTSTRTSTRVAGRRRRRSARWRG